MTGAYFDLTEVSTGDLIELRRGAQTELERHQERLRDIDRELLSRDELSAGEPVSGPSGHAVKVETSQTRTKWDHARIAGAVKGRVMVDENGEPRTAADVWAALTAFNPVRGSSVHWSSLRKVGLDPVDFCETGYRRRIVDA